MSQMEILRPSGEPHVWKTRDGKQFTGMLDVNGVEIYEGDIVKSGDSRAAEVFFRSGSFMTYIEPGLYLEMSQNSFEFEIVKE